MGYKLIKGDCLEIMPYLEDNSMDMILCDLPYGTTACKWDTIIPFEPLWENYKRLIKDNGAIVLTASQPFATTLISSNMRMFRYDLVWDKGLTVGFYNANKMPLRKHELILVFYKKIPTYNPQKTIGNKSHSKGTKATNTGGTVYHIRPIVDNSEIHGKLKFPSSIICINKDAGCKMIHPTQKPVALFEYLIKTYTNEGNTVLDNCAGSGTTGVACENINRNSIMIEKDEKYCEIIEERMKKHKEDKMNLLF